MVVEPIVVAALAIVFARPTALVVTFAVCALLL
jgi:hypothetical protein